MIKVKVNSEVFGKKFNKMLDAPKFKQKANNLMEPHFERAKERLLNKFNKHKVTQEIEAGPTTDNSSGLLNGYGNLFSFIGFPVGENPIEELRFFLEDSINFKQTVRRGNTYYFRVECPSMQEIEQVTPMPWEHGNSWVDGIEHGMSNLSHYLYVHWNKARSEEGIQLKHDYLYDASFETTPYLSKMLNEFRERFGE